MARNGSGTYTLLAVTAPANTVSSSTTVNNNMNDIATALTESINKDGTKAWAANQSVGSNKFTSLADGSARSDSINMGQVQDGKANWVAAGGTADVITATYSPAITALVDGQECTFRASAANTSTTPTFSPNGLTARTIVKNGGSALAVGDIAAAGHEVILKYLLASTRWELLNPAIPAGLSAASTTEVLTGTDTAKYSTPNTIAALWEAGSDVSDGAAITIGEGGYFNLITSTTAITSFSVTTDKAGRTFRVRFDTARTLTHNATSLILPGGANITTAQGDIAQVRSLGSGNVVVESYTRMDSVPITYGTFTPTFAAVGATFSYAAQVGTYIKVGKLVYFQIIIELNTSGNTLTAATLSIEGLPFTSLNLSNSARKYEVNWSNSTTSYITMGAFLASNATGLSINGLTAASASGAANINSNAALHATNGSILRVNGSYIANS